MELKQEVIEFIHNIEDDDKRLMTDVLMELFMSVDYPLDCKIKSKTITFAVNQNWYNWMAAINPTQKGVSLYLYKGVYLNDKNELLTGEGKYLRTIRFNDPNDIKTDQVLDLIKQAITFQIENVEK